MYPSLGNTCSSKMILTSGIVTFFCLFFRKLFPWFSHDSCRVLMLDVQVHVLRKVYKVQVEEINLEASKMPHSSLVSCTIEQRQRSRRSWRHLELPTSSNTCRCGTGSSSLQFIRCVLCHLIHWLQFVIWQCTRSVQLPCCSCTELCRCFACHQGLGHRRTQFALWWWTPRKLRIWCAVGAARKRSWARSLWVGPQGHVLWPLSSAHFQLLLPPSLQRWWGRGLSQCAGAWRCLDRFQ